jgi:hypothetical protein
MMKEPFVLIRADGTASGPASPRHAFRRPALVMLGGVALVLVIACVNITNLLLARSMARRRELGVRVAICSSRACSLPPPAARWGWRRRGGVHARCCRSRRPSSISAWTGEWPASPPPSPRSRR